MKKFLFVLVFVISAGITVSAQDTLVTFKFKVMYDSSQTYGNAYNADNIIIRDATFHGPYAYTTGADGTGDYCLSSTGWVGGLDSLKNYYTSFSSSAHQNILVSSRQRSSATGPRDFALQYKVGGSGTWTNVPGGSVICANDFVSGTLTNLELPSECNNYPEIYLRWVMTSNMSVGGVSPVSAAGTSRIDNVFILGDLITGVDDNSFRSYVNIYPNPSNGTFTINNLPNQTLIVEVFDILGNRVYSTRSSQKEININMETAGKGIYFVELTSPTGTKLVRKMIIK